MIDRSRITDICVVDDYNGSEAGTAIDINYCNVYDLSSSVDAVGAPKSTLGETFMNVAGNGRPETLAQAPSGSGHDCFLKGIIVNANIYASRNWWVQFQRYHFSDIISSQSTMHTINHLASISDKELTRMVSAYTSPKTIELIKRITQLYVKPSSIETIGQRQSLLMDLGFHKDKAIEYAENNSKFFEVLVHNLPQGIKIGARVTMNYLQLKTIVAQREGHKLREWLGFLVWAKTLPYANVLIFKEGKNGKR